MDALTPAERRGAMVVVALIVLGAGHDLWRASRPLPVAPPGAAAGPGVRGDGVPAPAGRAAGRESTRAEGFGSGGVLDLNRASAPELDALPGVGPVLAGRIVAHRARHGRFRHPEELLAVRGIGPRLYARLEPRVTVGSDSSPAAGAPGAPGPGRLQSAARSAPVRADSGSVRPPPVPITRQD